MPDSLQPHGLQPTRLLCPWDFPGKNTGVGSHFLLQGIFPTQGLNPGFLHCRQIIYRLIYEGKPNPNQQTRDSLWSTSVFILSSLYSLLSTCSILGLGTGIAVRKMSKDTLYSPGAARSQEVKPTITVHLIIFGCLLPCTTSMASWP